MMQQRYLAMIGADASVRTRAARRLGREFRVVLDGPAAMMLAHRDTPVIPLGASGAIIGVLRTMGVAGALEQLAPGAVDAVRSSRGQHLIDRYWGSYVALLPEQGSGSVDVVRAPLGGLPCFHITIGSMMILASDLSLLVDCAFYKPRLDRAALIRQLAASDVRRHETCLAGLREMRGGERLTIDDDFKRATLWSPWKFAAQQQQIADIDEAPRRLRDVARYTVAQQVRGREKSLLMLSGGLDSSVVAACLADESQDFAGLTFVTDNPAGDERRFARAVTDRFGKSLVEALLVVADVDVSVSAAAHLPRPVARSFEQCITRLIAAAALDVSASSVVNGGGGDNIFCSLQSVAPLADCLLDPVAKGHFWHVARELADFTQASVWKIARGAWLRARSGRLYRRDPDLSFLMSGVATEASGALHHPWLAAPAGTFPGKSAQVALLIGAQGLAEDHDPLALLPSSPVLVTQPLVETCLRIPSWRWFDHGCNRAAARHAFANELPAEIAWRRTKGTPDSFLIQILEANRALVRTILLDGLLAEVGVLDRAAVADVLDDPRPARGHSFARIMQLVDAEVWARGWPGQ
ncbi:MAG TPA: asparagine synthase-related protein [Sphingomonas sp.]|nr:asparagine synthase-related protein [Sphingomonas sp.]